MKRIRQLLPVVCLVLMVGARAWPAVAGVPQGYEPQVKLVDPKDYEDNSSNSSGKSTIVGGTGQVGSTKSGGFWGWLGDHGMGLVKGIGAGLIGAAVVVGVAALVVGAGAPLLIMAGAAVLGGAIYGAFTGSANFNWTEAIVGSVIGGVSAGVGSWIAGTGSSLATRAVVAAVDVVGGGIGNVASYLIHESNPTMGGAIAAFGIGAGTAGLFMGAGALVTKAGAYAKGVLGFGKAGKSAPNSAMAEAALADGTTGSTPGTTGSTAGTTGSAPGTTGSAPGTTGSAPGTTVAGRERSSEAIRR